MVYQIIKLYLPEKKQLVAFGKCRGKKQFQLKESVRFIFQSNPD